MWKMSVTQHKNNKGSINKQSLRSEEQSKWKKDRHQKDLRSVTFVTHREIFASYTLTIMSAEMCQSLLFFSLPHLSFIYFILFIIQSHLTISFKRIFFNFIYVFQSEKAALLEQLILKLTPPGKFLEQRILSITLQGADHVSVTCTKIKQKNHYKH